MLALTIEEELLELAKLTRNRVFQDQDNLTPIHPWVVQAMLAAYKKGVLDTCAGRLEDGRNSG